METKSSKKLNYILHFIFDKYAIINESSKKVWFNTERAGIIVQYKFFNINSQYNIFQYNISQYNVNFNINSHIYVKYILPIDKRTKTLKMITF